MFHQREIGAISNSKDSYKINRDQTTLQILIMCLEVNILKTFFIPPEVLEN